jgi:hypothetical protein
MQQPGSTLAVDLGIHVPQSVAPAVHLTDPLLVSLQFSQTGVSSASTVFIPLLEIHHG